jgi:hypothetical protein
MISIAESLDCYSPRQIYSTVFALMSLWERTRMWYLFLYPIFIESRWGEWTRGDGIANQKFLHDDWPCIGMFMVIFDSFLRCTMHITCERNRRVAFVSLGIPLSFIVSSQIAQSYVNWKCKQRTMQFLKFPSYSDSSLLLLWIAHDVNFRSYFCISSSLSLSWLFCITKHHSQLHSVRLDDNLKPFTHVIRYRQNRRIDCRA